MKLLTQQINMKNSIIFIFFLSVSFSFGQVSEKAFGDGEYFHFRVHYGLLTAGYAELSVKSTKLKGKPMYHVKGYGRTKGVSRLFFKVEDTYETYIDKETNLPSRFIRDIYEGGYTKDIIINFDHPNLSALVHDRKHQTEEIFTIKEQTQDLLSSFYYLRNNIDRANLKEGEDIDINIFLDKENYTMRLKYLGREVLRTPFGKIPALKFRPYVQSGRVFKERESLTIWVSDDVNKLPLLLQAELAVGSLKATLIEYKNIQKELQTE